METSMWCLMEAVSGQTGVTEYSSLTEKEHN